jgi:hypothetical protein
MRENCPMTLRSRMKFSRDGRFSSLRTIVLTLANALTFEGFEPRSRSTGKPAGQSRAARDSMGIGKPISQVVSTTTPPAAATVEGRSQALSGCLSDVFALLIA